MQSGGGRRALVTAALLLIFALPSLAATPAKSAKSATPVTSAHVPASDPVYQELDRLEALGLLPLAVLGQRPLSRGEISRLIYQASLNPRAARAPAREMLIRLRREFPSKKGEGSGEPRGVDDVRFGGAWLKDELATVPAENGVGRVDAIKQPLTSDRDGRTYRPNGGTFWLRTRHSLPVRQNLVLGVAPEFLIRTGGSDDQPATAADSVLVQQSGFEGEFSFRSLYGRLQFGSAVFTIGRDALAFGPSTDGGLILSTNARALDMVNLTSESTFRLPWIFRHLGPSRWFVGMAYLGDDRVLPKSALAMLRASFRLHQLAELGLTETLVMLGEGAPTDTFWHYLWEFFPAGRVGTDTDLADHRFGIDLRLHAWPGHVTLLGEVMVDDARTGHYEDVTARRFGIYLPAVGPKGRWELSADYLRLPAVIYRHGRWTTGYSLDHRLLGNELGPDSKGARLQLNRTGDRGQNTIIDLAWDARDDDDWEQEVSADDPDNFEDIFRVVDRPTETRWRGRLGLDWPLTPEMSWQPSLTIERVLNSGYVLGVDRTGALVELSFRYAFAQ